MRRLVAPFPGIAGLLPAVTAANGNPYTIVAFGDSTTAPRGNLVVYSTLLQSELFAQGQPIRVVNSGVGGNTTEVARDRFERDVLAYQPDLVVVQFGINDSAVDVWKKPPGNGAASRPGSI